MIGLNFLRDDPTPLLRLDKSKYEYPSSGTSYFSFCLVSIFKVNVFNGSLLDLFLRLFFSFGNK